MTESALRPDAPADRGVLLSISTLAGLILYARTGPALLDPVAGFVIAVFAMKEGIEAWHGELVEDKEIAPDLASDLGEKRT